MKGSVSSYQVPDFSIKRQNSVMFKFPCAFVRFDLVVQFGVEVQRFTVEATLQGVVTELIGDLLFLDPRHDRDVDK